MAKNLLIVESPAKAKTIKKYLGPNYTVMASMGHVIDLPKSKLGVDIENEFKPQYITIRGKGELLSKLKIESSKVDNILLATDPDREGEAISWHLQQYLDAQNTKSKRVKFNEITKNAVKEAVANAGKIDMNLVNAQQTRRILDRIVGYKISPLLWRKIMKGLSAGRVQSAVLRLICDRENEIKEFVPQEYWRIKALLSQSEVKKLETELIYSNENSEDEKDDSDNKKNKKTNIKASKEELEVLFYGITSPNKKQKKLELKTELEAKEIIDDIKNNNLKFEVIDKKTGTRKKSPPPPFTTSTLQQNSAKALGFTSKRTMSVAQKLYEGMDVPGFGVQGLITYMRTDSLRISSEAQNMAKNFINSKFGDKYLPQKTKVYSLKKGAQDAHEAIRPTNINITPEILKNSVDAEIYKLYKLIWERFVASQMVDAIYDTINYTLSAEKYIFKASGQCLIFEGFLKVLRIKSDDAEDSDKNLPNLELQQKLNAKFMQRTQHFTQPPARFNEASLIKIMEEIGIGRPSTYSPTINTILARGYVVVEKKILYPTELGTLVVNLMKEYFPNIVDVEFTANMESKLDEIESGEMIWTSMLQNFYPHFKETLIKAETSVGNIEIKLEESNEICEKCGRKMVYRMGKYGKFLGCPGFPECRNIKPILKIAKGRCPSCGDAIVIRKSKTGKEYFICSKGKACNFISWDTPIDEKCPKCDGLLLIRKRKNGSTVYCYNKNCGYEKSSKST